MQAGAGGQFASDAIGQQRSSPRSSHSSQHTRTPPHPLNGRRLQPSSLRRLSTPRHQTAFACPPHKPTYLLLGLPHFPIFTPLVNPVVPCAPRSVYPAHPAYPGKKLCCWLVSHTINRSRVNSLIAHRYTTNPPQWQHVLFWGFSPSSSLPEAS